MKSNSIKMYDKYSCLRVEMTINDPGEFKVNKEVHHKDGTTSKQWVPMGKSIANFYRYAEISKAANKRFLDSMKNIVPQKSLEKGNISPFRNHIGWKLSDPWFYKPGHPESPGAKGIGTSQRTKPNQPGTTKTPGTRIDQENPPYPKIFSYE